MTEGTDREGITSPAAEPRAAHPDRMPRRRRGERLRHSIIAALGFGVAAIAATAFDPGNFDPLGDFRRALQQVRVVDTTRATVSTGEEDAQARPVFGESSDAERTIDPGPKLVTAPFGYGPSLFAPPSQARADAPVTMRPTEAPINVEHAATPGDEPSGASATAKSEAVAAEQKLAVHPAPGGERDNAFREVELSAFEMSATRRLGTKFTLDFPESEVWTSPLEVHNPFKTFPLDQPLLADLYRPMRPDSPDWLPSSYRGTNVPPRAEASTYRPDGAAAQRPEAPVPSQHLERPTPGPVAVERPESPRPDDERPEAGRPDAAPPDIERPGIGRLERPESVGLGIGRPEIERPEIALPEIDRPEVERPEIERPEVEVPEIERPGIDRPEVTRPEVERPGIDRPDIERPEIERPEIERPEIERPEIERPEIERPEIERPEIERPEIERPEIERPEIERPEIERPEIERPEIERPEIERPEIERPEIERPEIERPEIERPEIERPEIERPEIERPEIERPEIERPEIERPGIGRPERPDVERPGIGRPDIELPSIERRN